jgi:hypothetical protein
MVHRKGKQKGARLHAEPILRALREAWSGDSSTKWSASNPAAGQCSPTALVVQDRFDGELLKTRSGAGWHFYNQIRGVRYDFTAGQFENPPEYMDLPASREEVMADCTEIQYQTLSERFERLWKDGG